MDFLSRKTPDTRLGRQGLNLNQVCSRRMRVLLDSSVEKCLSRAVLIPKPIEPRRQNASRISLPRTAETERRIASAALPAHICTASCQRLSCLVLESVSVNVSHLLVWEESSLAAGVDAC